MAIEGIIYDEGSLLTSKLMELSMERQKVIGNNIANVSTPGYIRRDLDFKDKLAELVRNDNIEGIDEMKAKVVKDHSGTAKLDGNNVTISDELNDMMQNSLFYNLMTRAFNTKMSIIKSAIK